MSSRANARSVNAHHHRLTRTFTKHLDVPVICVAEVLVSLALQFAVEFVENDS
jgi:hypothetical protein